jgi:hypothetical protein
MSFLVIIALTTDRFRREIFPGIGITLTTLSELLSSEGVPVMYSSHLEVESRNGKRNREESVRQN